MPKSDDSITYGCLISFVRNGLSIFQIGHFALAICYNHFYIPTSDVWEIQFFIPFLPFFGLHVGYLYFFRISFFKIESQMEVQCKFRQLGVSAWRAEKCGYLCAHWNPRHLDGVVKSPERWGHLQRRGSKMALSEPAGHVREPWMGQSSKETSKCERTPLSVSSETY